MSTPESAPPGGDLLTPFLAASGLTADDVPEWRLVNKFEVNRLLRTSSHNKIKCDCVAIPYHALDGDPVLDRGVVFYRARLLEPEVVTSASGKTSTKKYASPAGANPCLYLPRRLREVLGSLAAQEDAAPFVITEGEKKAEALIKIGIPAVGLPGVSMALVRANADDKTSARELLASIPDVVNAYIGSLSDQQTPRVLVLFDSDGLPGDAFDGSSAVNEGHVGNKSVFFEAKLLAKALRTTQLARPAVVSSGWCPRGPVGADGKPEKRGVDDWIEAAKRETGSADSVLAALRALAAAPSAGASTTLRATAPEAARRMGYKVLGFDPDGVVLWSRATQQLARLGTSELARAASILFAVGPDVARHRWAKILKNGDATLDTQAAAGDLIRDAHLAGAWLDARERGGGVWLEDDGDLRVNAREGFFRATQNGLVEEVDDQRFAERHVYPACGRFSIGCKPAGLQAGAELAKQLLEHFRRWGWKQKTAPYLLAGWVCQQAFLGALDARPSITLVGESGAGKSVLAEHVGEILGGTAYRIEDGAGTTSAGMRQTIGKDAMTILLDEAEPGANQGQVAEQRAATMRRTLDMLRAAYSASDGGHVRTTLKGSASGKAVDYSIRVSAMINAINRPDFDQADRNRFLLLEVVKHGRGSTEPDAQGLGDLGVQIRHTLWSRWPEFRAIYEHILAMADLGEARLRKTWGVPVAALMALSLGLGWSNNVAAVEELARAVAAEQGDCDGDASESDHDRARRALLAALIDCEVLEERGDSVAIAVRKRTVFEVFHTAKKNNPRAADNTAAQALKRVGLMRVDGGAGAARLFVSDTSQLRSALRGTPWATGQSIVNALARLDGAEMTTTKPRETRPKINGSRRAGVFVPVAEEDTTIDL